MELVICLLELFKLSGLASLPVCNQKIVSFGF